MAMKTDEERRVELEELLKSLTGRLAAIAVDKNPGDAAKIANAMTQTQHQLTSLEHLKLQRLKVPGQSPTMTDAELEAKSAEWLLKRGFQVTKRPG